MRPPSSERMKSSKANGVGEGARDTTCAASGSLLAPRSDSRAVTYSAT